MAARPMSNNGSGHTSSRSPPASVLSTVQGLRDWSASDPMPKRYRLVSMKKKLEKDQATIGKLTVAYEKITNDLTKVKQAAENRTQRHIVSSPGQEQKQKHKEEMKIQMALSEKQILIHQEIAAKEQKEKELLLEKHEYLQKLALDETTITSWKKTPETAEIGLSAQIKKLQNNEADMTKLIDSLRYQLELNNRTWEKKFAILKQSLHAIKDEMFLRQSLQRQPAHISRISINYAVDGPLGAVPGRRVSDVIRNHALIPNMPLPQIGEQPVSQVERTETQGDDSLAESNLADTGSDKFTGDDSQVLSDGEDLIGRISFLPSPPSSARSSRQSSQ
ncbi:uncharacterized protein C10orf67 homolog, mitochondrial [Microcaecilia unicolor]|uniref:Uncharacterized protein C10orf67 homolog, mitochondrial n=1 Tax=Microcaecilia unicolor TaxID=1415580 RepID=A0A6P7Y3C1_9AMPH|nr:uncharacterized protein C10orf67 homolog, mitochondrial [Microcaecilia unicolor]